MNLLLAGEVLIADDPNICPCCNPEESHVTFFKYMNNKILSVVEFADESQAVAHFEFQRGLEVAEELWNKGYDFAHGQMSFYQDGENIEMRH